MAPPIALTRCVLIGSVREECEWSVRAAFLDDGALVVAFERWVHAFPDPRGDATSYWEADGWVTRLVAADGVIACTTFPGRTHRLVLEDGVLRAIGSDDAVEESGPPVDGWVSPDGAVRVLEAGPIVRASIGGRERTLEALRPESWRSLPPSWVGRRWLVGTGDVGELVDFERGARAPWLDARPACPASTRDGRTVLIARDGEIVVADIVETALDWRPISTRE